MPTQQNFRQDAVKFLSRCKKIFIESQQNFRRVAAVAPSRRKFNTEFIKKYIYSTPEEENLRKYVIANGEISYSIT
jgi:hypothetical protein